MINKLTTNDSARAACSIIPRRYTLMELKLLKAVLISQQIMGRGAFFKVLTLPAKQ